MMLNLYGIFYKNLMMPNPEGAEDVEQFRENLNRKTSETSELYEAWHRLHEYRDDAPDYRYKARINFRICST
jgi:hypothetical protein